MANIAIFRINYKSDFILTLNSDAGWMTPFCIKFWTGAPSQAYFVGYDGTTYTHCAVDGEDPTKLSVQFDDHHLPIGDLKFQIAYHFTVADFPTSVEDEVLNQASVIIEVDDAPAQVMLDFNGETAPEIEFSLPAYANEAQRIANEEQRIANEQQRIANEEARIAAEETRQQNEAQRISQETARVNEFATLKSQSQAATRNANDAATLANQKAQLAADKAALADDAATLAIQKAQLAADKAALANDAAQLANEKAALAQQKAEYAQQQGGYAKDQGDYAKDQGDYAKAQGDIAQSDHERAEADHGIAVDDHTQAGNDHTRAEADHGIAANDHTQAGNDHTRAESDHGIAADDHTLAGNDHTRAESDHGIAADDHTQAGNDHTRAESDHTRAESDHAAVEVYVDSLGAFDISAYHATGGVLAKYADLTAALGTNGANIPEALRKGGMSVKFVQTSDNNYVQYRCIPNEFTVDVTKWAVYNNDVYINNLEFVYVKTDSLKKILWAVKKDGTIYFGAGVPPQVIEYVENKVAELNGDIDAINDFLDGFEDTTLKEYLEDTYGKYIENPEFVRVITDNDSRILIAIKKDGNVYFGYGVPTQIQEFVENYINVNGNNIRKYLDETFGLYIEDPEKRLEIKTDNDKKILSYRDKEGKQHEAVGFETPVVNTNSLILTDEGMRNFQQALLDSGFKPSLFGDFSDSKSPEFPQPKRYGIMNLIISSLPLEDGDVSKGYVEYYDSGYYFKKKCKVEPQGQTSKIFAQDGGKGNYTLKLDDKSKVKFGSWVPQKSFHLKGCAKDVTRGLLATSYKYAKLFMDYLHANPNRVLMDEAAITTTKGTGDRLTDWPTDARCLPDGFPVEVYINGNYWGLYALQLQKKSDNYSMQDDDYTSFIIDADDLTGFWLGNIPWTKFETRNPEPLICMDGTEYNGDSPKELIDDTSDFWDPSDEDKVNSSITKGIIESFSTKYLEVKALIDNDDIVGAKALFDDYFDTNACMFVYIFNCLMKNSDSVMKNTLWATYENGKIAPMLWDLDGMYGEGWMGVNAVAPTPYMWDGLYANSTWPLALFWRLYETEIKATYAELRRNNIISISTWHDIIFGWVESIGEEAYQRDLAKWPETPSYRAEGTNSTYWKIVGYSSVGYTAWNAQTTYNAGDRAFISRGTGNSFQAVVYEAKQTNTNKYPASIVHDTFPYFAGYYNSPKRMEKWMREQIRLCDIKLGYTE